MNIEVVQGALSRTLDKTSSSYMNAQEAALKAPVQYRDGAMSGLLAEEVEAALLEQDEFAGSKQYRLWPPDAYTLLTPKTIAPGLITLTRLTGDPAKAIAALTDLLNTREADGSIVLALWGVQVETSIDIDSDTSLLPFFDLPISPHKDFILESAGSHNLSVLDPLSAGEPTAALVSRVHIDPLVEQISPREPSGPTRLPQRDRLERIRLALTCIGPCSPATAASWCETHKANSLLSLLPQSFKAYYDIPRPLSSPKLDVDWQKERDKLIAVLALTGDAERRMDIPLRRLNRAMRHLDEKDKAIDLAIALESLLGDSRRSEITYRLSLRAGLLTPGGLDEQIKTRHLIHQLYELRSGVVHTGRIPIEFEKTSHDILERSARTIAELIKIIGQRGGFPKWVDFEMNQGA